MSRGAARQLISHATAILTWTLRSSVPIAVSPPLVEVFCVLVTPGAPLSKMLTASIKPASAKCLSHSPSPCRLVNPPTTVAYKVLAPLHCRLETFRRFLEESPSPAFFLIVVGPTFLAFATPMPPTKSNAHIAVFLPRVLETWCAPAMVILWHSAI